MKQISNPTHILRTIAQYNTTGEVWIDQKTTVRIYPKTNSEQMGGWNNWLRDWLGVFVM